MTTAHRTVRLDFSEPHVLQSEAEYDAAVAEVDELLEREPPEGSREADRLRFLSVLIGAYDDEHYPMGETSTPQTVVAFMLEQQDMTRADLAPILGGRSRVSEFFSGKRRLSVPQMQKIRDVLHIPADLLMEPPASVRGDWESRTPQSVTNNHVGRPGAERLGAVARCERHPANSSLTVQTAMIMAAASARSPAGTAWRVFLMFTAPKYTAIT